MKRKPFTNKEIKQLASNPYTLRVTLGQIAFTKEFKELFWKDYCQGIKPTQILQKHGYDTSIFGEARISGIQALIKKEACDPAGFYNGRRPPTPQPHKAISEPGDKIKALEQKVQYLEHEIEFLKKIFTAKNTRK